MTRADAVSALSVAADVLRGMDEPYSVVAVDCTSSTALAGSAQERRRHARILAHNALVRSRLFPEDALVVRVLAFCAAVLREVEDEPI